MSKELEEGIKERLHLCRLDRLAESFSGACISKGHAYCTNEDENIFVKTNASRYAAVMFDGEMESLKRIASTQTVKVPQGITVIKDYDDKDTSAIVLEYLKLERLSAENAKKLGENLSELHDYNNKVIRFVERASKWVGNLPPSARHAQNVTDGGAEEENGESEEEISFGKHQLRAKGSKSDRLQPEQETDYPRPFVPYRGAVPIKEFGFDLPTCCGAVPQINEWTKDWVSFYARHRLDCTIRSLLSDHSDRELHSLWSNLQLKVDKLFDDFEHKGAGENEIIPSLLHGDLWSGNAAQLVDKSEPVIYDPASFYGHSEYDLGIVRMFGGFPEQFEKAYFERVLKKKNFEKRNKLYQLFHHLNHWNHFGSGYRSSSLTIISEILRCL